VVHWKSHKSICVAIRAHPNGPRIISGIYASWKLNENKEFLFGTDGIQYAGDIGNGVPLGRGIEKYPDGDVYEGDFENGLPHRGTMKFPDGNVYEGDFDYGDVHGRGTKKYTDGRVYEGDYENGTPHGRGIEKFADGRVYEGDFENGAPHGRGTMKYADGSVYEGDFENERPHQTAASLSGVDAEAAVTATTAADSHSMDEDSRSVNSWEFDEDD
jgi:hypothetical protein